MTMISNTIDIHMQLLDGVTHGCSMPLPSGGEVRFSSIPVRGPSNTIYNANTDSASQHVQ